MRAIQVIHISRSKRFVARLLALFAILCRMLRRLFNGQPDHKRALILEPFGLGDVVSHEPLVRLLVEEGWDVTFCGAESWRSLFPDIRWINSEIAWGRHREAEKYRGEAYFGVPFRRFFEAFRAIARGSVGIDTRGDIRSVLLLYVAGCRDVVTLSNYLGSDLNTPRAVGRIVEFCPDRPRWISNAAFAELLLGKQVRARIPAFPHLRSTALGSTRGVCLMPVAPWPGKWWLPERWQSLAVAIRKRGIEPFGLCGPGQSDFASQQLGADVKVAECASVQDWAKHLQTAWLLVTLDSGPMHLANALDVPAIALFGQGLLPLWAPPHPDSAVVTHQADADFRVCAPIEANTEIGQDLMRRISVEEVLAAVDQLLQKRRR